jgi:hypothetical protein
MAMPVGDQPEVWPEVSMNTNAGTTGGFRFKKYLECCKCHLGFHEDEFVIYKGKSYGVPCGCSRDIARLSSGGK